ncbi:glycosyltransferase [Euzebya tangerina]|uniref:glycosyltransferase n=1 Tax=Euzebya tangerina TaxID=591198 RepID=UPI000E30FCFD|nr:glycosyltransferase [Euzebya tangerina]
MRQATTLMVASAGGHLTQLRMLSRRLQPALGPSSWVSYDDLHAESTLAHDHFVRGYGPSTRHLGNAARNWRGANRVLAGGHIERVISTGAGIAVPYLMQSAQLGIPTHYIESASRVTGPSLSGRLLEALAPGVKLYTQYPDWAGGRWQFVGSIYEGFMPSRPRPEPTRGLKVLVSLGTHPSYTFPRLVQAVRRNLGRADTVVWQLGVTTSEESLPGRCEALIPADEMSMLFEWADVVVAHAGTGVILSCLQAGKHPVVLPRDPDHDEHVDNHQRITATEVERLGLATVSDPDQLDRATLTAAASRGCMRSGVQPFELDEEPRSTERTRPLTRAA